MKVQLLNVNIPCELIAQYAGICYDKFEKITDDKNLLKSLWKKKHFTPFEFQQLTFYIEVPIYIAR